MTGREEEREMNKIHIVRGSSGAYEDYAEWDVVAYTEKEEAEKHAKGAQLYADAYDNARTILMREGDMEAYAAYKYKNPYDPGRYGGVWSDGIDYKCVELERKT